MRVILDSRLKVPLEAKVLGPEAPTILATARKANPDKAVILRERGIEVIEVGEDRVDLKELLLELAQRGVLSLLVEGGREVLTSFLREGLADEAVVFVAPKIMGQGIEAIGNLGVEGVQEALALEVVRCKRVGPDRVLEGRLRR